MQKIKLVSILALVIFGMAFTQSAKAATMSGSVHFAGTGDGDASYCDASYSVAVTVGDTVYPGGSLAVTANATRTSTTGCFYDPWFGEPYNVTGEFYPKLVLSALVNGTSYQFDHADHGWWSGNYDFYVADGGGVGGPEIVNSGSWATEHQYPMHFGETFANNFVAPVAPGAYNANFTLTVPINFTGGVQTATLSVPYTVVPIMTDAQAQCYLNRYPDLASYYGATNITGAKSHWLSNGYLEGRNPNCYSCTGTVPTNATMFAGDNLNLSVNTPYTYWAIDTGTRCQYSCNSGYTWNGSSCVVTTYSCTGTVPANATMFANDNTGLVANTIYTYAASNTALKCEYACNSGYAWNGSSCVAITYSCLGSDPANATLISGDNTGLGVNTNKTVVIANTSAKCEYTCNANATKIGTACVLNPTCNAYWDPLTPGPLTAPTSARMFWSTENASSATYSCTGPTTATDIPIGATPPSSTLISFALNGGEVCTVHAFGVAGTPNANCSTTTLQINTATAACTGSIPLNSSLATPSDNIPAFDTPRTLVPADTASKCEYICSAGWHYNAGVCVLDCSTGCTDTPTACTKTCGGGTQTCNWRYADCSTAGAALVCNAQACPAVQKSINWKEVNPN